MRSLLFLCVSLAACSASTTAPGGGVDDGGVLVDETGAPIDAGGKSDAGKSDAGGGDTGVALVPYCQMTCSVPSDCATASAAFDADNYACEGGVCRYEGCNSDAECQSTFSSTSYVCRPQLGLDTCVKKCSAPADCAVASPGYDADNYACESGGCVYKGCNTDAECASSVAGTVCRKAFGSTMATCIKACSTASDCATASAAFDTDNYACDGGLCRYKGCNSAAECQSALMKSNYTCK